MRRIEQIAALALLYLVGGWLGLQLAFYHSAATLIWPPSGISLAALIVFGVRLWPGVFIGALTLALVRGIEAPISLAIAIGNTLEAVVGAMLLTRVLGFRPELDRLADAVSLLVVGGGGAALISASIGATSLWLADDLASRDFVTVLLIWWRGDLAGVLVLTPILLLMRSGSPAWAEVFGNREFWVVSVLLFGVCIVGFSGVAKGDLQTLAAQLPLMFLVWAGARLGTRGTVAVTSSTLLIAIFATSRDLGPFVTEDPNDTISMLWIYCMGLGSTALILAALISQRDRAESQGRRALTERMSIEREHLLLQQRERIMREMHDGLGGQLISVLSMVQRGQASSVDVAEGLRRALDDMRIMIDSLEASPEGLPGLLGKLRARLDPLLRRNGLDVDWRIDARTPLDAFDPEHALHCIRIIQEAVANVIQHARANRICITIAPREGDASRVEFEIRDDGMGDGPGVVRPGHGMKNMQDRAREIGGEIHFEKTDPGRRVVLSVPHPTVAAVAGERARETTQ